MYWNPPAKKVLTWLSPCLLQDNGPAALCTFLQKFRSCKLSLRLGSTLLALNRGRRTRSVPMTSSTERGPRGFATLVSCQEMICALTSSTLRLSHLLHHLRYATAHQATFCAQLNPVITSA